MWSEIAGQRTRTGRTYEEGSLRRWSGVLGPIHYESVLDSGQWDAEIDCSPVRVDNAQFDGWRITASQWHYAIGKDIAGHGDQDGWVGFGGRQGQNWLKFRLLRTGYLHWPTRAWDDIGGAPTYDRANLISEPRTLTIGPNDDAIHAESVATWANIWRTPGAGSLAVSWRVCGDQLKEQIVINQAAREWIAANRPPATALTETWFGFVFLMDWSDIPRVVRDGVLQDLAGDFADDGSGIEIRDALDRLLGLMPIDHAVAGTPGRASGGIDRQPLRKRFYYENGNHYLLLGVRCDTLAGMRVGPLAFDPSFNIASTYRDAMSGNAAEFDETDEMVDVSENSYDSFWVGYDDISMDGGWIWETTIPDAPTITAAYVALDNSEGDNELSCTGAWWGYDVDSPDDFNSAHTHRVSDHHTRTTATVTDNINTNGDHTSPSLATIVQEICDRAGVGANPKIGLTWRNAGTSGRWYNWGDYSDGASLAATLDVTYSAGGDVTFAATIAVATTTPDDVDLVAERELTATIAAATTTPDTADLGVARPFSAVIAGATTTPDDVDLVAERELTATIAAATTTPDDVDLGVGRGYAAVIAGTTTTPDDAELTTAAAVTFAAVIAAVTTTPDDAEAQAERELTATIAGATTTPDTVDLGVERTFAATMAGVTTTPDDVDLGVDRGLAATIAGATTTPDTVDLGVERTFAATIAGVTTTPDTAGLGVARGFAAVIAAATVTPDDSGLVAVRSLAATISAATTTPVAGLLVERTFAGQLRATTTTPDDVTLAMAVVVGLLTVVVQGRGPATSWTGRRADPTFTGRGPNMTFTED